MPAIAHLIRPKPRDLGEFTVRRVLPAVEQRMVGPFVFLDHMGPVAFEPGQGLNVRPHPHIGLATVTYLFEGEIVHRDSLGSDQSILPGDVNWMTAGRGIVHSERSNPILRQTGFKLHGLQSWVALPLEAEETEPAFHHHRAATLPDWQEGGVAFKLIAGTAWRRASPVKTFSPLLYVDLAFSAGASVSIPDDHAERGLYVAEGDLVIEGEIIPSGEMATLETGAAPLVTAGENGARVMLLGGAPLDGQRYLWWNFVSSSKERIEQAKADWRAMAMGHVAGDDEFIPLPDH